MHVHSVDLLKRYVLYAHWHLYRDFEIILFLKKLHWGSKNTFFQLSSALMYSIQKVEGFTWSALGASLLGDPTWYRLVDTYSTWHISCTPRNWCSTWCYLNNLLQTRPYLLYLDLQLMQHSMSCRKILPYSTTRNSHNSSLALYCT